MNRGSKRSFQRAVIVRHGEMMPDALRIWVGEMRYIVSHGGTRGTVTQAINIGASEQGVALQKKGFGEGMIGCMLPEEGVVHAC